MLTAATHCGWYMIQTGLKEASPADWKTLCCCHQQHINTPLTVGTLVPTISRQSITMTMDILQGKKIKEALVIKQKNFNQDNGLAVSPKWSSHS